MSLNEVKTLLAVSFPGYVSFKSTVRGSLQRGGTVLLVKNHLAKLISSVDTSVEDQIWIRLQCAPKNAVWFLLYTSK